MSRTMMVSAIALAMGLAAVVSDAATAAAAAPATETANSDSTTTSTSPTDAAPDSADALGDYLGNLSQRTNDDFLLQQLSIDDAAVDSLIHIWEETGTAPGEIPLNEYHSRGWAPSVTLGALRYSRVEGVNIMGDAEITPPGPIPMDLFARAGWGWASEEATWRAGLRTPVPYAPTFATLEVTHTRDVLSYGSGGVPGNSLLALTAGRDLDDYFLADGLTATVSTAPGALTVDVSFSAEHQSSLANETDFTVFDEGDLFRLNPSIDDGRSHRLALTVAAGDAAQGRYAVRATGGVAGRSFGGEFDYETLSASIITRRRLWFGDEIKVKLDGGLITGNAPYQGLHFLGGTQRLRGYDINEFGARKSLHLSADYLLGTNPLGWLPYLRRLRVQPVPFADAAAIFERQLHDGTIQEFDDPKWLFDVGVGLQYNVFGIPGGTGQMRLDIARRLDRGSDNTTYRLGFTVER